LYSIIAANSRFATLPAATAAVVRHLADRSFTGGFASGDSELKADLRVSDPIDDSPPVAGLEKIE
jgi:hypothetical protein